MGFVEPPPSAISRPITSVAIVMNAFSTCISCLAEVSKKWMLYSLARASPSSDDTACFRGVCFNQIISRSRKCFFLSFLELMEMRQVTYPLVLHITFVSYQNLVHVHVCMLEDLLRQKVEITRRIRRR